MARTKKILKSEIRITDHISLGALTRFVPKNIINDILKSTYAESKRKRLLPGPCGGLLRAVAFPSHDRGNMRGAPLAAGGVEMAWM